MINLDSLSSSIAVLSRSRSRETEKSEYIDMKYDEEDSLRELCSNFDDNDDKNNRKIFSPSKLQTLNVGSPLGTD